MMMGGSFSPPKLLIQTWALKELLENSKETPESFHSSI
jgi:hypothetical protein